MPRKLTAPSNTKAGDVQPVKDFDFNKAAGPSSGTLMNF
jgi:hypothetical protein